MKNRNIGKIIFYTILILCISAFSYFPKSYSRYIKKEIPLNFYVHIDNLYDAYLGELNPLSTSTYKVADYKATFKRSDAMREGDDSQYVYFRIEQQKCYITKVQSKGTVTIQDDSKYKATIKYTDLGEDTISVYYSCNVDDITETKSDGKKLVYTNINIREKIMPENVEYLYMKALGVPKTLEEYYDDFPITEGEISADGKNLTVLSAMTNTKKYESVIAWLKEYSGTYKTEVEKYLKSVYATEEDIVDTDKILKGFTVLEDSVNNTYIYQIDDDFIGYARTYYNSTTYSFNKVIFSNLSLTDEEANEILEYYFTTYSEYTPEEIEKIMAYVSAYESINHILIENPDGTRNTIAGFEYSDDNVIKIKKLLMSYVNTQANQEIIIDFNTQGMMHSAFISGLSIYDFLTTQLINDLSTNIPIANSVVINNTSVSPKTAYDDYFIIRDERVDSTYKNYILVHVSSDSVTNTVVRIVELTEADLLTLAKENNNINISITVDNTDTILAKENVINMVAKLDKYFETSYEFAIVDELFTSSTTTIDGITSVINENKVTISYTIGLPTSNVEESESIDMDDVNENESTETNVVNNNEVFENNNIETE